MLVITDVCPCEYTLNGHCGIIRNGYLENEKRPPEAYKLADFSDLQRSRITLLGPQYENDRFRTLQNLCRRLQEFILTQHRFNRRITL
jgi:hypothetical protein